MGETICLSVDLEGSDGGSGLLAGAVLAHAERRQNVTYRLHGTAASLAECSDRFGALSQRCEWAEAERVISPEEKAGQALRRGRNSSMWNAVADVAEGRSAGVVSGGNTGALMAISMLKLRTMDGVHRPAMTALWPTMNGFVTVLDVGANLEASPEQLLVQAIMGSAYARALTSKARPSVGVLNVGSEDTKGPMMVAAAAEAIADPRHGLNYAGYVEGHDISSGAVDVVVTDGFTGNVALKTAEGTARLVGGFVREALTSSASAKAGAVLARGGLSRLKERMDPSNVNGGVLLGVGGLVVKSHGGADEKGVVNALELGLSIARSAYDQEVRQALARLCGLESGAMEGEAGGR